MPRPAPTPELANTISSYVRNGAFPDVAAEAAGVPRRVFLGWMRRGRRRGAREPYRSFAVTVLQAAAQCRAVAEMAIRKDGPLNWLKYGPGRERRGRRGWTTTARPCDGRPPKAAPADDLPAEVVARLLDALTPFPEARAAAAAALTPPSEGADQGVER